MAGARSEFNGPGIQHSGSGHFNAGNIYIGTTSDQLLADLRVTDPRGDKSRIEATNGGLLEDSYRWILDHKDFQRWRDDSQSRLLWIKGDPGKGKTMLLCGIINELDKTSSESLQPAYFFCQATDARLNSATAVIRGLLYMLVGQHPQLVSYLHGEYKAAGKSFFEDFNAPFAMSKILIRMLDEPILEGKILVVDALDECVTDQTLLLNLLRTSSFPRIKWVVSSRNWPPVEEALDTTTQKVRLCLELNSDSVSAAVQSYIRYKVDRLALTKKYDLKMQGQVRDYLTSNADDTFLWVALVCQELADAKVRRVHTLTKLKAFPRGLNALYGRMMDLMNESADPDLCRQILAVVSITYRPSTLKELAVLVEPLEEYADDIQSLQEIVYDCGSFLTLRDNTVYFVHQSAKDYLLNKASSQILPLGIPQQHHDIFLRALDVLSSTLRRDIYELHTPGFSIDDVSTPNPDPLGSVQYSYMYWVDHLHGSNTAENLTHEDLQDDGLIHVFLKRKYLYWLEAVSLLRKIPQAVLALQKLETLVGGPGAQELKILLRDARRFILFHKGAVEIAPLQLYASALVFSPSRSIVRKHFKKEEPNWIISTPAVEPDWNACMQTLEGHSHFITSVAFSADGQRVASASWDGSIKVWNSVAGACMQTLEGHKGTLASVAFLADSQRVASASWDGTTKVWDTVTGACVQTLEGYSDSIISVVFSADSQRVALGTDNKTIKVLDIVTGACVQTLKSCSSEIRSAALSADGRRIALRYTHKTIKVWDIVTGACVQTMEDDNSMVYLVAFSADSQQVASGSDDGTIKIWEIPTGACVQTLKGHSKTVASVAFSKDSQWVASGSWDHTIKIWDAAIGVCLQTLEGHHDFVNSVAFSGDSQQVASGSNDCTIKIWDIAAGGCVQTFEGHSSRANSVAFSADSQWVASGESGDCTLKVWDPATGACMQTFEGHCGIVKSVAFSADGQQIASGDGNSHAAIKVWDVVTGVCVQTMREGHGRWVNAVALSADGQQVASGSDDGTIKVWDITTGACVQTLEGHSSEVKSVTLSADGHWIASGSSNGIVKIWEKAMGTCIRTLEGHGEVMSVAFSPDGQRIASGSSNGTVKVWETATGACIQVLKVGKAVIRLTFSTETNTPLSTDIGVLVLHPYYKDPQLLNTSTQEPQYQGYGISPDTVWIVQHTKRLLWLPPEYRPSMSAVAASTIVLNCLSGRVLIIQFSTNGFSI